MDSEDRASERKIFDHTADQPSALLDREITQHGFLHVDGGPAELESNSLGFARIAAPPVDRSPAVSASRPGNALYLASIAVIAIAIAGIFFDAGYSLLQPSSPGPISSLNEPRAPQQHRAADRELGHRPSPAPSSSVAAELVAVPLAPAAPLPVAGHIAPPADGAPQKANEAGRANEDHSVTEPPARSGSAARPAHQATEPAVSVKAPITANLPDQPGPKPSLSEAEIADLLKHGDAFLSIGDLTSARLFYERAATAGDSRAALRLGATFDPDFLERAGLRNVKGDPATARSWYSRALDLGAPEASRPLNSLNNKQ